MAAKILIVDDEPDFQDLISQNFMAQMRAQELQFVFAENGAQALDKLRQDETIDVVLTDINMPVMDGLALLGELPTLHPLTRAVVVSAYGDMQNIRIAMNRGAFDFLIKPVDFEDLNITLRKTLQAVQQLKESLRPQQEKLRLELCNQFIRKIFGRYVCDEVVEILLESPEALQLGGEKRQVTILISDLRGFTSISERLSPEQVVTLLNRYFETMVDVVLQYGGTINEILGDSMLIIFGAPVWRPDDALRAVACAVAMQLAMTDVNAKNQTDGLPALEMGIGLNTGEVVAGNIGSLKRTKYGIVGRHVNLTSRIESCTIGNQILISNSTLQETGPAVIVSRQIKMEAKGFDEPITLNEVKGVAGQYNFFLPAPENFLVELSQPLPVLCTILEGKHATGASFTANFVKLSDKGGEALAAQPPALLVSLKMRLSDAAGKPIPGDIYGKVIANDPTRFQVHFTTMPPEAEEFLQSFLLKG